MRTCVARLFPAAVTASVASVAGVASVAILTGASGCSPNAVCKMGGPINDPSNRTERRQIMSYGLSQFCTQMTTRNAPLKMSADAPVTGRFYPQHCTQQTLANGDLLIQFDGIGYAFTPLSRKVGFSSAATIQYDQDFKCASDNSIYAYFATRSVSAPAAPPASPASLASGPPPQGSPSFNLLTIEAPVANLVQGWITPYANNFGTQMLSSQLAQGFTVIQGDDGSQDFTVGQLALGQRPSHPFDLHGADRAMVESQRVQVATNERDFIGPIDVEGSGRALYLTASLDGAQAVDLMILPKAMGDAALQAYINVGPVGALPGVPPFSQVLAAGTQYQRAVPVPAGMYYVVIDNTPSAGQVAPPVSLPFGTADQAAVINYAIQIGDAP